MMYNQKMAVALKHKGKVLREVGDTVYLPFGSEYSIFLKNMNSVRALVTVTVDGQDVGDGSRFIVNANDDFEIERFIRDGNLDQGNRLKFIERTSNIENHRGIGVEDGLIRVEFNYEHVYNWVNHGFNHTYLRGVSTDVYGSTPIVGSVSCNDTLSYTADVASASVTTKGLQNDAGITVPGSVSDQTFKTGASFPVEATSHVIILKLLGQTETNQVTQAVTVKTKPKCTTCGKQNKATAKFCTECGTSLTLV